jgi:ATP synthase protein I
VAHDPNDAPQPQVTEDPALDSLETRLAAARKAENERLAQEHAPYNEATGLGWSAVSTMVGYPLGGIIIGFAIDQMAGTTPWVTIGLMFTAFAGGVLQVARLNKNRNS